MKICQVLQGKKGLVQVQVLDNGYLCWSKLQLNENSIHLSAEVQSIPPEDILHVKIKPLKQSKGKALTPEPTPTPSQRTHSVVVLYVRRSPKGQLRMATCQLDGTLSECQRLACDLNDKRGGPSSTNRKFLVLINPVSGNCHSQRVFRNSVEPLFKACDIGYDVVVSSRRGELERIAETRNLDEYSGLLIFGGDGSVNEVVNGLLLRRVKEAGLDINDKNCQLVPATIPVGIFATGSGNYLCDYIQGNMDVVTTAILALKGRTLRLNAITIHEPEQFRHMAFLVLHVGFVGDIVRKVELNRWMGPVRYKVFSHTAVLSRRLMSVKLTCSTCRDLPSRPNTGPDTSRPESGTESSCSQSSLESSEEPDVKTPHEPEVRKEPHESDVRKEPHVPDVRKEPHESDVIEAHGSDAQTPHVSDVTGPHGSGGKAGKEARGSCSGFRCRETRPSGRSDGVDADEQVTNVDGTPGLTLPPAGNKVGSDSFFDEAGNEYRCPMDNTECIQDDMYNVCLSVGRHLGPEGRMETAFGRDTCNVMAVKKCSLSNFVKHFVQLRDNVPGLDHFSFVESREVKALKLALSSPETRQQHWFINSDGECVPIHADVCYFRVHPRVFQVFGPDTGTSQSPTLTTGMAT